MSYTTTGPPGFDPRPGERLIIRKDGCWPSGAHQTKTAIFCHDQGRTTAKGYTMRWMVKTDGYNGGCEHVFGHLHPETVVEWLDRDHTGLIKPLPGDVPGFPLVDHQASLVPGTVIRLARGDDSCGQKFVGRIGIIDKLKKKYEGEPGWITAHHDGGSLVEFGIYTPGDYEVLGTVPVPAGATTTEIWNKYKTYLQNNTLPPDFLPWGLARTGEVTITPLKESNVNLSISITGAETIDGWVGQVRDCHGKIIWQTEPQTDAKDEKGQVTKTGSQVATEVASDKVSEVLKGLFA